MATVLKGYESTNITAEIIVYTTPALTTATIIGMTIANTSTGTITVSVKKNLAYIIKDVPILVGSSLVVVGGEQKTVVEAEGTIKVSATGTADVIMSMLEQS